MKEAMLACREVLTPWGTGLQYGVLIDVVL